MLTYSLGLTVTGASATGVVVTDSLPANVTYVGSGPNNPNFLPAPLFQASQSLLNWTFPPLAPGTYQLTYQTQVNSLLPPGSTLLNRAVMSTNSAGPVTSVASVEVSGSYKVVMGIYNEAGELVDQFYSQLLSQALSSVTLGGDGAVTALNSPGGAVTVYYQDKPVAVWNGNNSSGTQVSNGTYFIKVDNFASTGSTTSSTQQVTVSRNINSIMVLIYNEAGEIVRHLYGNISDPGPSVTSMSLSTQTIAPSEMGATGDPTFVTITLSNGVTLVWDGKGDNGNFVTTGKYLVSTSNKVGAGTGTFIVQPVFVDDRNLSQGVGVISARPNVLANGNLTTTFQTNSTLALTLRVSIYTVAGELVRVVEGEPGSNQAQWDAAGLASGVYLGVVEVRGPDGGLLSRQTVKLMVLH